MGSLVKYNFGQIQFCEIARKRKKRIFVKVQKVSLLVLLSLLPDEILAVVLASDEDHPS